MTVKVILVDDDDADRYIARRQLIKIPDFESFEEMSSGDIFIDTCLNKDNEVSLDPGPTLILMDINMPGSNGFEVMDLAERMNLEGQLSANTVFLMFSSSKNPQDFERAKNLSLVKGFVFKPLDYEGAIKIYEIYRSSIARKCSQHPPNTDQ